MEKLDAKTRRKAIKISIWEGLFTNIHSNLAGGLFATGFIKTLGATNIHYAWLTALPTIASVTQIVSAYWIQLFHHRKFFTIITTLLARMLWLPILIIPFFLTKDATLTWFFVFFAFICILGTVSSNAWTGWMADLVPGSIRGRYFSRRALILTIGAMVIVLIGGIFMEKCKVFSIESIPSWIKSIFPHSDNMPSADYVMLVGFSLLFIFAIIMGIISIILLTVQADPPVAKSASENKISMDLIYNAFRHKTFVKLLIFMVGWNIITSIAAPFWTPYLLNHLQMGYDTMGLLNVISSITRILSLLFWGKVIDRFGAKPVIFATVYFGSFHPLYYVVSNPNFTALIYLDSISSGIMWSGVEIAVFKMLLGSVPAQGKEIYYAIYATITGIAGFFPQFLGAAFADSVAQITIATWHLTSLQFIMVFETIGRLACLGLVANLNEPAARSLNVMLRSLPSQIKEIFLFK